MDKTITTIRHLPETLSGGNDYYLTQGAIILSLFCDGETIISDYDDSGATDSTLEFLREFGLNYEKSWSQIGIRMPNGFAPSPKREYEFEGGAYPLGLILAVLAGKNIESQIHYTEKVGGHYIDTILRSMVNFGIGLKHDLKERIITISPSVLEPIEQKISSPFPHLKDMLLVLGISSGKSVAIREEYLTSNSLENLILGLGGKVTERESKREIMDDPDDPRRRFRRERPGYRREIMLHPSAKLRGTSVKIPQSQFMMIHLLTLAALKRGHHHFSEIPYSPEIIRWMNYLKSVGIEITEHRKKTEDGLKVVDLEIKSREFKARRASGETVAGLIEYIPLMALLAALSPETSLIRGIREYDLIYTGALGRVAENLGKMGVKCGVFEDGLVIEGTKELNGADFGPFISPGVALAFYIAALAGHGQSHFAGFDIVKNNYGRFVEALEKSSLYKVKLSDQSE
ncbi:putative 3-phosphoshikimate 1-carboxyvinyltransferase [Candidatus Zixiibacteriota bacterium]|nr:putative 3-phosphoshikimate 1-carboxyvinyltransferase [candidate division Zixibacteria bacterium]